MRREIIEIIKKADYDKVYRVNEYLDNAKKKYN